MAKFSQPHDILIPQSNLYDFPLSPQGLFLMTAQNQDITWAIARDIHQIGLGQTTLGIRANATSVTINAVAATPVDYDLDAARLELFKNMTARLNGDRGTEAWRRLRAEVAAAKVKVADAEARCATLRAQRDQLLVDLPADLATLLVTVDRELREAEQEGAAAKEGAKLLERPLGTAAEAAKTATMSAAEGAITDFAAALKSRRDEVAARLCRQVSPLLTELAVVELRAAELSAQLGASSLANVFLRQA